MTIKDIAKLSGYSITTVSRAINNKNLVSKSTYTAIMKVVKEHNFVPNNNAKQLKQSSGNQIALIIKGTSNMIFSKILEEVQQGFTTLNYATSVYYIDEDSNEVEYATKILREFKPLGFVFFGSNLKFFKEGFNQIKAPSVVLTTNASELNFHNLSSVYTDDISGAAHAVEHLIDSGHSEIGILGGSLEHSPISQLRYLGCVKTYAEVGRQIDLDKQFQTSRFSFNSAYKGMQKLYLKYPELTAVFAMSDVMAIGAIRALADLGKNVPKDISVIGFDGIDLAQYYTPRLTTIKQNHILIAQKGVALLSDQIENGADPVHESVPFELLIGESVI